MKSKKPTRRTKAAASAPPSGNHFHPLFDDRSMFENPTSPSLEPQTAVLDWLEALLDAALVVDDRSVITQVNMPAETLFGYTRAELIGQPVEMLVPEHLRAGHAKRCAGFFAAPRPMGTELELYTRRKNGTEFHAAIALSPLTATPGTLTLAVVRDITERKQTEEALRESEEKFRAIASLSPAAIAILKSDEQGERFLYVNAAWETLTGYPRDDAMLLKPKDIVHPDMRARVTEQAATRMRGEDISSRYENKIITKNGEIKWLDFGAKVIRYQGAPAILTMAFDITESKRVEHALQESEERFRRFSAAAFEAIIIHEGGILISANEQYYEMFGYKPDELMGKQIISLIIAPEAIESARKQVATGGMGPFESIGLKKDGTKFPLEIRVRECEYQGRKVRVAAIMDITERKRVEEKLQHYNRRLMILHDIDRGIVIARSPKEIVNAVLKHIRGLISCRMAFVALYEHDTNEIVIFASDVNGNTIIRPGMRIPAPAGWVTRMLKEKSHLVEDVNELPEPISPAVRLATADATRSYLTTSLVVEGNLIGGLILSSKTPAAFTAEHLEIAIEVSNQLAIAIHQARMKEQIESYSAELEERVAQRTAQLESANKDLESFSYSVSHDLRAPLRAISGFAAIIARRHRADLNEEGRHYVDNIVLASERMGLLIDALLQHSRLGRSSMSREQVPLREVFDTLESDLAARLKEISGKLRIADDLPTVMGDKTLLNQVFANVLENAITYRKPDVPVQVTVACHTKDKDVIVCVEDNGIGIHSEYHKKIFNVFQRLHRDDEYPGTGIGLATVKKSVELLGGRVWVDSVAGKGSKFFVALPKE